ncbi:hypothetical protein TETCHI1a_000095 [Candidatus Hodgkinia cicadicola]|nr:hypothetical protein TETCHI1a_000095 [Candidatus Hodgkinia cicadicola]
MLISASCIRQNCGALLTWDLCRNGCIVCVCVLRSSYSVSAATAGACCFVLPD